MHVVLPVWAKLNVGLRAVGRRADGYHDLVSIFLRIPSGEALVIGRAPRDEVSFAGLGARIDGEDTVSRALRLAREAGADVPPLKIEVRKAVPPGSGLGAGSGDAAALLQWLAQGRPDVPWADVARRVGADVPFLLSGHAAALVSGTGDRIDPVSFPRMRGVVAFPAWDAPTAGTWSAMDEAYGGAWPLDEASARDEAARILRALEAGERLGLLPNDFLATVGEMRPRYDELSALFGAAGHVAWGMTGSGSAAFSLFHTSARLSWPEWIRQVLCLSVP
ncbi:MAG: 4-diphosphocytidyl-2C-methyl-D-erythritol kinase [Synergistaceae bacterium]|nr:4-diphosphocytidyl-2C-methyl-D-erythritol kinase [Synergistaceae bacterium]